MSTSVSLRLADATAQRPGRSRQATDRPKTYFIEKAIESYLAEYADYQVALDRLRDKDDPIVSASELRGSGLAAARVDYKASVAGDLDRLKQVGRAAGSEQDREDARCWREAGEPLTGEFAGLFRIRVGDYRVIYSRTTTGYLVLQMATAATSIGGFRRPWRRQRRSPENSSTCATGTDDAG